MHKRLAHLFVIQYFLNGLRICIIKKREDNIFLSVQICNA